MRRLLAFFLLTALASAQLPLEGGRVAVKITTDKKDYQIGDLMTITVKSQITGYLLLLWTDSSGVTRIAVPSQLSRYDRVYAGQTLQVRDATGSHFEQTGPSGTETLQAVVTAHRLELAGFTADSQVTDPQKLKEFLETSGPFGQASVTYTVR